MAFPDAKFLVDAYENPGTRRGYEQQVVAAVLDPKQRVEFNALYNSLNLVSKTIFQVLYSDLFRRYPGEIEPCTWTIDAWGARLDFPLRPESIWLDWGLATAVLGHDLALKEFYIRVVDSRFRPRCFLDVGANYGTHSLFFLAQGVPTVTFEPNPSCVAHFEALVEFNRLRAEVVSAAVGAEPGEATLVFPERESWLGSISLIEQENLAAHADLKHVSVPVVTLDEVMSERTLQPGLIKIDTEGFDLQVIRGARETLETHRPMVVFESNTAADRDEIREVLEAMGFGVYRLNTGLFESPSPMSRAQVLADESANFVALHADHGLLK